MIWRDRIVESTTVEPEKLLAHPGNWRAHTAAQTALVGRVIDAVGWVRPVIVNRRTGRIVDGHLRVSIALDRGMYVVPVDYIDVDEREETTVLATFDPIAELATYDSEQLARLIVNVDGIDMSAVAHALVPGHDESGDQVRTGGGHVTEPAAPNPYDRDFDELAPTVRQLVFDFDLETFDTVSAQLRAIGERHRLASISHVFWWLIARYEQDAAATTGV